MFNIATEEEIRNGKVTDVYFVRTKQILEARGIRRHVKAEFIVKKFPHNWKWGVVAGIEDCINLLKGFKGINLSCMQEGTFFKTMEPVMVIEGSYTEFGIYETALLGFLCQASGIATKAARCKKAAQDRPVVSFGARRVHPAISSMVERNAYIGGCDGVASIKSAEDLGIEPSGTIPHALILLIGDSVKAIKAFDEVMDKRFKRIALIDTLGDEKFEAIGVAEALGKSLYGVRLDTPASRRGDFLQIIKEVRWELDLRGLNHVKIFISGGIDEEEILKYNPGADAYGIGTSISSAPVLDFAMDIVEIDGKPMSKRGKYSGEKQVWRCSTCYASVVSPIRIYPHTYPLGVGGAGKQGSYYHKVCNCPADYEGLLSLAIKGGDVIKQHPSPQVIREYVLNQLRFHEL